MKEATMNHQTLTSKKGRGSFEKILGFFLSPQTLLLLLISIIISSLFFVSVFADPSGPTITIVANLTRNTSAGTARTDAKGFIYTTRFAVTQQSTKWKAYVGNITGSISLS